MTPSETVRLLAIVQAATPAMRMTEATPDVWHRLLADLPYAAAEAAVFTHTRSSSRYLAPADIRRKVAQMAGLLPPSLEDAMSWAQRWATQPTPLLAEAPHSAVAEVCRLLGSSFIAEQPHYVVQKRFAAAYDVRCKEHEEYLLSSDLGRRLELAGRVQQIEGAA